jgi:hypothetical protein
MESQTVICSSCQAPNPARNLFCQSCGKPMAQQAAQVPPIMAPMQQAPAYPPQQAYPQQAYPPQPPAPAGYPAQTPGYPPQQPGYYAPAPVPAVNLGTRLDAWVSVVEGAAEKAADVEAAFVEEFKKWQVPQANAQHADFPVAGQRRGFQMVQSFHGMHAVGVNAVGPNLQVSWGYYKRLLINWPMIGILAGVAFGFSLVSALFSMIQFAAAGFFFSSWLTGTISYLPLAILVGAIYGLAFKGSLFAMFIQQPDSLTAQEAAALSSIIHQSLVVAVEKTVRGAKLNPKSNFRSTF